MSPLGPASRPTPGYDTFSFEPEGPHRSAGVPPPDDRPAGPAVVDAEVVTAEVVDAEVVDAEVVGPAPRIEFEVPNAKFKNVEPPVYLPPLNFAFGTSNSIHMPASRRAGYRELAQLRRLRRAWRRLRASVADPSEPLHGPAEVCGFLEAVAEVTAALAGPAGDERRLGPGGRTVRTLARHPFALAVLRSLVPPQRSALARDWAVGLAAVEGRTGAVRRFLATTRPGPTTGHRVRAAGAWLGRNPEAVLAAGTVAGLLVAAVR